jgi:arabinogalactan oligomer/maltooligosaccharide transport system substrate-binding protein
VPPSPRRSALALLTLLALAGLQGCRALGPLNTDTLHVYVVPTESGGTMASPAVHVELAVSVMQDYRRLHPEVNIRLQVVPEERLEQELQGNRRQGLGPDLLLVRASVAISLRRRGLIAPLPRNPAMADAVASIVPGELTRVREQGELVGLPVAEEVTLACYDRQRVPSSPTDVAGVLALAASGSPVGVSADPIGLWWSAGSLGAAQAMALLITDRPLPAGHDLGKDQRAIEAWLRWLRQAALQSRVDIAAEASDLVDGLTEGRLSWIPCYSLHLMRLHQRMGPRLGVAPLPGGPGGQASPFSSLRIWAFGTDSSANQRRLAEELARFTLSPKQQRELTLTSQSVLPVNRFVMVPVAESGRLAAMAKAQQQFRAIGKLLATPYSADRVRILVQPIEQIIYEVMLGVTTPERGARRILALRRRP